MIENIENEKECCGSCDFVCLIITETQYVLMTIQNINTVTLFLRMMKYAKTISYDLA